MTGYETALVEVLSRMRANPKIVTDSINVRRAHRTLQPRSEGFAVHVIDGSDQLRKGGNNSGCAKREGEFTISLFARSDSGPTVLDALKVEVYRRMALPWDAGFVINPGRITIETESADADAVRVDMDFEVCYQTAGEWSLELQ